MFDDAFRVLCAFAALPAGAQLDAQVANAGYATFLNSLTYLIIRDLLADTDVHRAFIRRQLGRMLIQLITIINNEITRRL
jgi:hypothetical protein